MCNRLADELEQRIKDGVSVVPEGTKRILITGTPLAVPNWKLHNIIETSGAVVVCEEMCTGTRYFENLVDESAETLDEAVHESVQTLHEDKTVLALHRTPDVSMTFSAW